MVSSHANDLLSSSLQISHVPSIPATTQETYTFLDVILFANFGHDLKKISIGLLELIKKDGKFFKLVFTTEQGESRNFFLAGNHKPMAMQGRSDAFIWKCLNVGFFCKSREKLKCYSD